MDADVLIAKLKMVRPDTPVYLLCSELGTGKLNKPEIVSLAKVKQDDNGETIIEVFPSSPGFEYNALIITK